MSEDTWKQHHRETSQMVRRALLGMVAFSFYCVLMVAAPDSRVFATGQTLSIPVAQARVSFETFFLVAPLTLVAGSVYLHVLLGHLLRQRRPEETDRAPALFNLESRTARVLSTAAFYWMAPVVCALIAWKGALTDRGPLLWAIAAALTAGLVGLQLRRTKMRRSRWSASLFVAIWAMALWVAGGGFLGYLRVVPSHRGSPLIAWAGEQRRWKLNRAELEGAYLRGVDLSGANLKRAQLRGANLGKAILSGANLSYADLRETQLQGADLRGANLRYARVDCAFLAEANLRGANLRGVDLGATVGLIAPLIEPKWRTPDVPRALPDPIQMPKPCATNDNLNYLEAARERARSARRQGADAGLR